MLYRYCVLVFSVSRLKYAAVIKIALFLIQNYQILKLKSHIPWYKITSKWYKYAVRFAPKLLPSCLKNCQKISPKAAPKFLKSCSKTALKLLPLWFSTPVVCISFFIFAGEVQSTEMKGRGMCLVRFSSERDAIRAYGILLICLESSLFSIAYLTCAFLTNVQLTFF